MNYEKPVEVTTKGNDIKGMYWSFILYPQEDLEHKQLFDLLENHFFNNVRYILHDKDKWRVVGDIIDDTGHYDGEPKKAHYHFIFKTEHRISIDKVSAMLGLPTYAIERVNSVGVKCQYLLHRTLEALKDDYKHKYADYELHGCLPIEPNKWDESYLFTHWSLYIKNTNQLWGDVVFAIVSAGHYKWLNKYRRILKDIYDSSHYLECSAYENENHERSKKK